MGRKRGTISKDDLKKGSWTPIEDGMLMDYINIHGEGKWSNISKETGLKRCGKSCRLRWLNHLRPNIKRGNISDDEEELIIRMHKLLGNRWSLIAGRLPGRTDNEIKNFWHTKIAKKAHPSRLRMRRSPQTERNHKSSLTPKRNCMTTRVTESESTAVVFDAGAISQQDEVQEEEDSLPLMASSSSTNSGNLEFIRTDREIESSSNDLTTRKLRNGNEGDHGNHCMDDFCKVNNLDSDDHFTMLGCISNDELVQLPATTVEEKYWWATECGKADHGSDFMSVVSFLNSAQEWTGEMI